MALDLCGLVDGVLRGWVKEYAFGEPGGRRNVDLGTKVGVNLVEVPATYAVSKLGGFEQGRELCVDYDLSPGVPSLNEFTTIGTPC